MTYLFPFIALLLLILPNSSRAADEVPDTFKKSSTARDSANALKRTAWWRDAKFGMFIHWGLYSKLGGEWKGGTYPGIGEWIMYKARIPLSDYKAVASEFDAKDFDADSWAQLAKDAGMKYVIFTAKHHDGFAMFGSKADKFNIVDASPFHRDPVKEMAAACAKRGLHFGVYYSQAQDWSTPGGAIWKGPHEGDPVWKTPQWDPVQKGDFDTYFEGKAIPQVRELLTNYGPIAVIWFDTPLGVMTAERAAKLRKTVRELQPDALVSGRISKEFQSDYDSAGDNETPDYSRPGLWETPATLNHTWGYKKDDNHWKTSSNVIFKLVDIVSKGGNYLLNIGPDGDGIIPQPSLKTLLGVGRWLKINGDSIYGASRTSFGVEFGKKTEAPPLGDVAPAIEWRCSLCGATQDRPLASFEPTNDWRCTSKPECLYIHLFKWPSHGRLQLPPLKDKITKAFLLADPERKSLKLQQSEIGISIAVPPIAPDSIDSVLCLERKSNGSCSFSPHSSD